MKNYAFIIIIIFTCHGGIFASEASQNKEKTKSEIPEPEGWDLGKLWVIGDSWSVCFNGNTWRRKLYQDLISDGYTVDFVGTMKTWEGCDQGEEYDRDHNAVGGITAREALDEKLDSWLKEVSPDRVLMMLGGNDMNAERADPFTTLIRLQKIIEQIRAENPSTIFHVGMYGYVSAYFSDQQSDMMGLALETFVESLSTDISPAFFVDHRVGWDKEKHLDQNDLFHPSKEGMEHMADGWKRSIERSIRRNLETLE